MYLLLYSQTCWLTTVDMITSTEEVASALRFSCRVLKQMLQENVHFSTLPRLIMLVATAPLQYREKPIRC